MLFPRDRVCGYLSVIRADGAGRSDACRGETGFSVPEPTAGDARILFLCPCGDHRALTKPGGVLILLDQAVFAHANS